jgi:hypothetical protein
MARIVVGSSNLTQLLFYPSLGPAMLEQIGSCFIFTENDYSYRSNNFAFACNVLVIYCYGYLRRK